MNTFKYLLMGSLLLGGCAHAPKQTELIPVKPVTQAEPMTEKTAEPLAEVGPPLPDVELDSELLYELLLTEFANQRGHKALAVEGSTDIARKTRDPRLAKRAAQLALESGDMNKTVDAFRFWQEIDPTAGMTPRVLSSLLLRGGRLEESRPEFLKVFKMSEPDVGPVFLQIYPLFSAYPDKKAALQLVRDLASPYPKVAESHWMVAQLAQAAGDEALALTEVREARRIKPDWDYVISLEAQLLRKKTPEQSLSLLAAYLDKHPQAGDIRLQYARTLLEQKEYLKARKEFQILADASPDNVDLAFAVALISLQLNDLPGAEAQLKLALGKHGQGREGVSYFLGQLSEAKENEAEALVYYREVSSGEYQFPAQLRVVYLLSKKGQYAEARQFLKKIQAATDAQRVQLVLIEARLLRDSKQYKDAYQVLQQSLIKDPSQLELLYEAAMLGDLLGHHEASEQMLRKLIKIKPDHAQAYNALGYSLLERNVRIPEAMQLVEKALLLAPDDLAIMDSVGWGYFRSGRLDESVAMLRRAYAGNPDPEIAVHLGEALWTRGDKEEAAKLWQDSLKANPDNAMLQAVIKRFQP
jgi:tetratricopeptide (TPR) repeat protein